MKKAKREEILDYVTYTEQRAEIQKSVLPAKALRRYHVGEHLTFLFENAETVRYQVHEMMRVEQIVKEAEIQHELDTYNDLLGADGELGCTLMIEIAEPEDRDVKLRAWLDLPKHLFMRLGDGTMVRPKFDERQVGDDRLSSVQYLTFDTKGEVPVLIGSDHPELQAVWELTKEQQAALRADLDS